VLLVRQAQQVRQQEQLHQQAFAQQQEQVREQLLLVFFRKQQRQAQRSWRQELTSAWFTFLKGKKIEETLIRNFLNQRANDKRSNLQDTCRKEQRQRGDRRVKRTDLFLVDVHLRDF